ncbi:P-loop containing nucleoside triphosphate hydrolase protein [Backusella circina FSU 941]|nr:P-loop containing nucleoside triphosphate hydrolase protein [Backusella circina FSU 941]
MKGDNKPIHSFFKARKAVARDPEPNPISIKKKRERSPSPRPESHRISTPPTHTNLVTEAKLVASCSYSTFTPMEKPKFESQVGMPPPPVHEYDIFGMIEDETKKKKTKAHVFDLLYPDRSIFGNAHLDHREEDHHHQAIASSPLTPIPVKYHRFFTQKKSMDSIKARNDYFMQQRKKRQASERSQEPQKKKKCILLKGNIRNTNELEAWLDKHFPHWRAFPSCVHLAQSITFTQKNTPPIQNNDKSWIDKYRPKETSCLLGSQKNSRYLKHWLQQMKIKPMSAPSLDPINTAKRSKMTNTNKKKKKKKPKLMDDFFIDDSAPFDFYNKQQHPIILDDDEDDDDFIMGPKMIKKQRIEDDIQSNVLLLVGDCGVGKTAAVYTAAEEVGYEVFEIHSGMKRSGKEITSAVGDMTKNHLVTFEVKTEQIKKRRLNPCLSSSSSSTNSNGKSMMMKNFLRKASDIKKGSNKTTTVNVTKNVTKQSLILLEDVDLLYEEDKGFWSAVSELSQKSKRPIIMTCNDPSQVPVDSLYLQSILDLEPPSDTELLPYLWLICFKEGHQVDPIDVICLLAVLGRDIRRLLQTLQLFCGQDRIFGRYIGFDHTTSLLELKKLCQPSKTAVDTFRLARCYQEYRFKKEKEMVSKEQTGDSLDDIYRALESLASLDSWEAHERRGDKVEESKIDQINGFVQFIKTDEIYGESKENIENLESTMTILSSQQLKARAWQDFILDEPSHWEELFDAKCCFFDDYYDATEKLLPTSMLYNLNADTLMMEYIPYIQSMIEQPEDATRDAKRRQTRSKRKRLYLPLNDEQADALTRKRTVMDETLFWCERFPK